MRHKFALGGPDSVLFADSANLDAFSRLRTSDPTTLFECQCQYDAEPTKLQAFNENDGLLPAHSVATRMVQLQVSAGAVGGRSLLQSFQYVHYQPGKSQYVALTGVVGTAVAGAVKRFGYGDTANGIFFEQNGVNGLFVTLLSSTSGAPVATSVAQANWNIDRLDGTGPSGKTLSPTNCFILIIDLQFLGMGRVRIGFDIDGVIYYAHQFLNAGVLTVPYMQTASLPVLAEIQASAGLAAPATAWFKCAQVASEGGFDDALGRDLSVDRSVAGIGAGRNLILAVQPRTTFAATGITNRGTFVIESIDILGGTTSIYWELVVGATLAGTVFADVNTNTSFMTYTTAGTFSAFPASAIVILSGYVAGNATGRQTVMNEVAISYPITLNRAGAVRALGTLALLATPITGTPDVRAAFNWRELR